MSVFSLEFFILASIAPRVDIEDQPMVLDDAKYCSLVC